MIMVWWAGPSSPPWMQIGTPARHAAQVVVPFAEPLAIGEGGLPTVAVLDDVVQVADLGVAVRHPAGLVPKPDQLGELPGEAAEPLADPDDVSRRLAVAVR